MTAVYQRYGGTDLALLDVAIAQEPATVQTFLAAHPYPWTFLTDPYGAIGNRYRDNGIPLHLFIDKQGVIRERHTGVLTAAEMEQAVQRLLQP